MLYRSKALQHMGSCHDIWKRCPLIQRPSISPPGSLDVEKNITKVHFTQGLSKEEEEKALKKPLLHGAVYRAIDYIPLYVDVHFTAARFIHVYSTPPYQEAINALNMI